MEAFGCCNTFSPGLQGVVTQRNRGSCVTTKGIADLKCKPFRRPELRVEEQVMGVLIPNPLVQYEPGA